MKLKAFCVILVLSALFLAGCGCQHEWIEADCINPRTCSLCEETEGEPLSHDWREADCERPKTCVRCAETEGEALGHKWMEATCEAPRTCENCKLSEGDALEHDYQTWWLPESNTILYQCKVCDHQEEEANTYQNVLRRSLKNTVWNSQYAHNKNSGEVFRTRGEHVIAFDDQYGFTMNLGDGEEYTSSGTWTADHLTEENEMVIHHFVVTDEEKKVRGNLTLYQTKLDEATYGLMALDLDGYILFFTEQKEEQISAPVSEETKPEQTGARESKEAPTIYTDEKYAVELEQLLAGAWETTTTYVSSQKAECPLTKVEFTNHHTAVFTRSDGTCTGVWTFSGYELLENANGSGLKQEVYFLSMEMDNGETVRCALNHFENFDSLSVIDLYNDNEILSFER